MHLCEFVAIFLFTIKLHFFGGNNLGQIYNLLWELLDQLPIGQIDSYLALFLNTIESFAKARVFGNIWNFLKNRRFSKIPQKKMHKKIKKVSRISKFWSLQVQPQSKFYKIKVNNLFPNFSRRFFFILFCFSADFIFYIHRMNQPLPRFGWDFI